MNTQVTDITADTKFLKRILFCLVAATITAGTLAGVASVNAGANTAHFELYSVVDSQS